MHPTGFASLRSARLRVMRMPLALLKEYRDHILWLSTTLDATQEQHNEVRRFPGAFERTVKSIDTCLRMGIPVSVRTNFGPGTIASLPALATFYESRGWFDFPNFKCFVTPTYDRQHDFEENFTVSEDEALSGWLRLRDEFPLVRRIQTLKFAPSLSPIMRAFDPQAYSDINDTGSETSISPMVTYCLAADRKHWVFTGAPNYSIYSCPECTGLLTFRIGRYYPHLSIDPEKKRMWGIEKDFNAVRSIERLQECKHCRAATLCAGYCPIEAIVEHGCSDTVFCKQTPDLITRFLRNESARLYRRARALLDSTANEAV